MGYNKLIRGCLPLGMKFDCNEGVLWKFLYFCAVVFRTLLMGLAVSGDTAKKMSDNASPII